MMASSVKEKFDAAVKVIRGLPANGPFQPSYDLMLKFYSYYKQATEGKCNLPKPSFWDVVNKKKWEAWNKLGDMGREKAMTLYVDELKKVSNHVKETYYPPKIVETMPQTEEVGVFLQKLDTFYEMVEETPPAEGDNSDDNNDVKAILPNGDAAGNVKAIVMKAGGGGDHDSSQDQDVLNHSDNVTLLLKQDMKRAQDSAGILVSSEGGGRTNGYHSHNGNDLRGLPHINGNGAQEDDDDDDDDDDEEEEEDSGDEEEGDETGNEEEEEAEEEEFVRVDVGHNLSSSSPNDASGVGRVTAARNGVTEWSESETENEEFCDTSDEPVHTGLPDSPTTTAHLSSTQSSALLPSSHHHQTPSKPNIPQPNASTPIPYPNSSNNKSVRANGTIPSSSVGNSNNGLHQHHHHPHHHRQQQHHHHHSNRILSDSLEVQTSRIIAEKDLDESTAETFIKPTTGGSSSAASSFLSISPADSASAPTTPTLSSSRENGGKVEGGLVGAEVNCRGGEGVDEAARDRRRKGGSQSSRGGGGSGPRRGGSSGGGTGGSEGGARPPYPNRGGAGGSRDPPSGDGEAHGDLNEQIVVTLLRLQRDMSGVLNRLHSLEALVKEGRREQAERKQMAKKSAWWWPFPDLTFKSAALVFMWPIVLQVLLAYISRRRSRRLRK